MGLFRQPTFRQDRTPRTLNRRSRRDREGTPPRPQDTPYPDGVPPSGGDDDEAPEPTGLLSDAAREAFAPRPRTEE